VEAEWEQSDEFHEKWKLKSREYLAQTEWKRRKSVKRVSF
jgi:DnaJ family protein C protein 8